MLRQRLLLLNAYRSSLINISSLSYYSPSISIADKALLTAFNTNMARISGEITQNSPLSMKEEISNLTAISKDCILPVNAKSNEVSNFQSEGRVNINYGNFVMNNSKQIITDYEN